ncbi:Maf family protein [Synergistaceae bacterium OttesenSCG-928-D05]|nr:Maf family protein [Synergistaceae bacterium OttesenSCG-928-D05]
MRPKFILASGSPRRRAFFEELGWDFEVQAAQVTEDVIPDEAPQDMVRRLAEAKAADVYHKNEGRWVVGADTTVVIDGKILGKPGDKEDARRMISMLQGKTHTVMTGVAVIDPEGRGVSAVEKTDVTFRPMTEGEVTAYVDTGESMDKAGAYAIQGHGTLLVERVAGCYFNVVGLPLERLSELLTELGWPLSDQWRV